MRGTRDGPVRALRAPQLSAHAGAAARRLRHLEYFHDHARLEPMVFDGCLPVRDGAIWPLRAEAGNGLTLRRDAVARYGVAVPAV